MMKEEKEIEKEIESVNEESVSEKMEDREERGEDQKTGEQQRTLKQDDELMAQLDTLLKEAEQVGYLRARNEFAEAIMNRPRLWENSIRRQTEKSEKESGVSGSEDSLSSGFLKRIRPGVWD